MKETFAYLDINSDCTYGVPALKRNELRYPYVASLDNVGKILDVLEFTDDDISKYLDEFSSLKDFLKYLDSNRDLAVCKSAKYDLNLAVEDFDVLYSKRFGFINFPWSEERFRDKCRRIREYVKAAEYDCYKYDEKDVRVYNLNKLLYQDLKEDNPDDEFLDKSDFLVFAQRFVAKKIRVKSIFAVSNSEERLLVYLTSLEKNHIDTINAFKEIYSDVFKKPIYLGDEWDSIFKEKDKKFMKLERTKENYFINLTMPSHRLLSVVRRFSDEANNFEYKIAEDIIENLKTYEDENVQIYETSKRVGISNRDILKIIEERECKDIPRITIIHNINGILTSTLLAKKEDEETLSLYESEQENRDIEDFNSRYIAFAKNLRKIEEEKKKFEMEVKKSLED